MKVLVVGSGGREHALCWSIAKSPLRPQIFCAPGNAGISELAECIDIKVDDLDAIVAYSVGNEVDLVIVGPELPLVAGLVDRLEEAGIRSFGPTALAARIEGSKRFMKDLCARYEIPTAEYRSFDEPDEAKEYIRTHGAPIVVKADGLAAGKGVIVCRTENEAFAAIDHILTEGAFGSAGSEVVVEEYLEGEEASFLAMVHGTSVLPLASAQDHKAAYDGDEGPNTGGMGAYSPAPIVTPDMAQIVMDRIVNPAVRAMSEEGCPFSGILYAGLMIENNNPKLLEFNCRFGDPECQPLLVRLRSDLLGAVIACTEGRLSDIRLEWDDNVSLAVVLASKGYPGYYSIGSPIKGLGQIADLEDVYVFHAGTKNAEENIVSDGGRVLAVTACGPTVAEAQKRAYEAVALIDWPDGFCRRDIGWRAIKR